MSETSVSPQIEVQICEIGDVADEDKVLTNDGLYDIVLGDWVVANYDGKKFPGEVKFFYSNSDVKINVMHGSGKKAGSGLLSLIIYAMYKRMFQRKLMLQLLLAIEDNFNFLKYKNTSVSYNWKLFVTI